MTISVQKSSDGLRIQAHQDLPYVPESKDELQVSPLARRTFIVVPGRAPAACPQRQAVLAGGRTRLRASRTEAAGPPAACPSPRGSGLPGQHLARRHALPYTAAACPQRRGQRDAAPSLRASRRGAGVRYPMRQARTCRLHNHRRPHTYPALHKGPCARQPPRRRPPPAAAPATAPPAGGPGEGGREAGGGPRPRRLPRPSPSLTPFLWRLYVMEHSRNGPTSHPLQGTVTAAQRAHTHTHAHPGAAVGLPAQTHTPCARRPLAAPPGDVMAAGATPPRTPLPPARCLPPRRVAPGSPLQGTPSASPEGAGGRGESPAGLAPQAGACPRCWVFPAFPNGVTPTKAGPRPPPAPAQRGAGPGEGPPAVVPRGRCRWLPAPQAAATEVTYRSGGFTAPPASSAGALPRASRRLPSIYPLSPAAGGARRQLLPVAARVALGAPASDPPGLATALSAAARTPTPRLPAPRPAVGVHPQAARRGCQLVPVTGDERQAGRSGLPADHHHRPGSGGGLVLHSGERRRPGSRSPPCPGRGERWRCGQILPGYSWHHFPEHNLRGGERAASAGSAPPVTSPGPPARRRGSEPASGARPAAPARVCAARGEVSRAAGEGRKEAGLRRAKPRPLPAGGDRRSPSPSPPRELPGEPVPTCRASSRPENFLPPPARRRRTRDPPARSPPLRFLVPPRPAPACPGSRYLSGRTIPHRESRCWLHDPPAAGAPETGQNSARCAGGHPTLPHPLGHGPCNWSAEGREPCPPAPDSAAHTRIYFNSLSMPARPVTATRQCRRGYGLLPPLPPPLPPPRPPPRQPPLPPHGGFTPARGPRPRFPSPPPLTGPPAANERP
ncbi:basic proline-rich protein-like [Neopsephotus bourkii]|uniref:basic proline-rich protein-like n=1 Tax=Neopsephotus bourkii TaxID=309878 RepID=UPI002AA53EA8|nr:basic proline-rich protein-like [Neopsephotus bourkii]